MNETSDFQVMNNLNNTLHSSQDINILNITQKNNENIINITSEKRRRTNYSLGGNKVKIEEAVKYLLELSERARPNVRNVAEKV